MLAHATRLASEMYGYSFGCAKAGLWHVANDTMMLYPEYMPGGDPGLVAGCLNRAAGQPCRAHSCHVSAGFPSVMHYGIQFDIGGLYSFHKQWFHEFDPLSCPHPETTTNRREAVGGLLPAPPHPSQLPGAQGMERLQHLYAAVTVATLNEAFCELHLKRCPLSAFLLQTCLQASSCA